VIYVVLTIVSVVAVAVVALAPLFLLLFAGEFALNRLPFGRLGRFLLITLKSLRRNLLRTSLTYLATFVLVVVVGYLALERRYAEIVLLAGASAGGGLLSEALKLWFEASR